MKFYKVDLSNGQDGSCGFVFETTKRAAEKSAANWIKNDGGDGAVAIVIELDIKPTKQGILSALTRFASHADNG